MASSNEGRRGVLMNLKFIKCDVCVCVCVCDVCEGEHMLLFGGTVRALYTLHANLNLKSLRVS